MALKLNKKTMNMAYGLGAAIVIIGALMKIIHKVPSSSGSDGPGFKLKAGIE